MRARRRGPGADRPRPAPCPAARGERGDDDGQGGELLGGRLTADDPQQRTLRLLVGLLGRLAHSGMFPCFFGGSVWRLLASSRSALVISTRVSDGRITWSMYPRSAAT